MPARELASLIDSFQRDPAFTELVTRADIEKSLVSLWLPLAERISSATRPLGSPRIVGLAGAPGVGKTTLANALAKIFQEQGLSSERLSLEDVYYEPQERARRDLTWRAVPGSHDLERLEKCLSAVRECQPNITLPRYDMLEDRARKNKEVGSLDVLFLEGWIVGTRIKNYAFLRDALDFLIFIDAPQTLARRSRLDREAWNHVSNGVGFDAATMTAFWTEALEPGVQRWVNPIRSDADLVLELNENRCLEAIRCNATA